MWFLVSWVGILFSWLFWLLFLLLKFLALLLVVILFALWKHQGAILYQRHQPKRKRQLAYNPKVALSPQSYRMPYDSFYIRTKDNVNIHCWLLKQKNCREVATFIVFHGNAGAHFPFFCLF